MTMPAGRPRKPIPIRAAEGDTRQRGARKHAEALAHYEYLADGLFAEGLLARIDQGALVAAATAFAAVMEAHKSKKINDWEKAVRVYMQMADRLGLHESARAKFTRKDVTADPIGEAMCG